MRSSVAGERGIVVVVRKEDASKSRVASQRLGCHIRNITLAYSDHTDKIVQSDNDLAKDLIS